jgi:5,5'-dehydrodivanillate O-demethylase
MSWHPIYEAEKLLSGRAVPVQIMSERFTLYRGQSGTAYLVGHHCPHRQTQLSIGWVEGENIRCFYHGWMFDGAGSCVQQPAEPKPFVHKVGIPSYPVKEYLGLIFAYLGEGEAPEFPRLPEFEGFDGALLVDPYIRNCNYFQNLENALDTSHVGFVHRTLFGAFDGVNDSPICMAEESEWGIAYETKRPSGGYRLSHFGMPNRFNLAGLFSADEDPEVVRRDSIGWWVPIDDEKHLTFFVRHVPTPKQDIERVKGEWMARRAKRATTNHTKLAHAILAGEMRLEDVDQSVTDIGRLQDDLAQIGQGKIANRQRDQLGQSDVGVTMIRRLWARELQALADGRPLKKWTRAEGMRPISR